MPELRTAHIGSYPRIGESKDQQRYRRGYGHFERKEISAHAFRDVEQSVIHELILEQIAAGVDEVTDALLQQQLLLPETALRREAAAANRRYRERIRLRAERFDETGPGGNHGTAHLGGPYGQHGSHIFEILKPPGFFYRTDFA
jgi:hypothetical protein